MIMSERVKDLLFERPIKLNDAEDHKIILKRGFLSTFIYSIGYGIYEYFVVYNYITLHKYLGSVGNWIIMYVSLCLTVAFATRYNKKFNFEQVIMGLMFMAMFEDVIFWICLWIDKGHYPYPAGNWWDSYFAIFRILGGLGRPIPIWPYVPIYYIPGFAMVIAFYLSSYYGPKYSRIAAWILGPLFITIIAGTLSDELFALIALFIIPSVSYAYILILLYKNQWNFRFNES